MTNPTPTDSTALRARLERIKSLNTAVGAAHLLQAIVMIFIANDFAIAVEAKVQDGPPGTALTIERVFFGPVLLEKNKLLEDMTRREMAVFAPLVLMIFWLGLYPKPFFKLMEPTVDRVMARVQVAMPELEQPVEHAAAAEDEDHGETGE